MPEDRDDWNVPGSVVPGSGEMCVAVKVLAKSDDIITPEMIEAGLDAYFMHQDNSLPDETVRQVYLAMLRAKA